MNKCIGIFESKYGSTRRYAQWISQALSCPLLERKEAKIQNLLTYDTIIYGGGLYAGGVSGIKLLTDHYEKLRDKHLILFTCGLADPADPENVAHIREGLAKVLSPEMLEHIRLFHFRGRIDYTKLGFVHKNMMKMLHSVMVKKDPSGLREEDKQMLETYGKTVDFTDQTAIHPLIEQALHFYS